MRRDAVSVSTRGKMEDALSIAPTSELGLPYPFGLVHLGPGGEYGGTQFRQWYRWKGVCWDTRWQECFGCDNSTKS